MSDNTFKIYLKKNTKLSICSCGHSKKMPICDNSHREKNKKNKLNYKSVKVISSNDTNLLLTSKMWLNEDE